MSLHPSDVSLNAFHSILARYQHLIETLSNISAKSKSTTTATPPLSLAELDHYRLVELPKTVERRKKEDEGCYLEKNEVEKLIRWKLKHGKFRPSLISLVSSNDPSSIKSTTSEAYKFLTASNDKPPNPTTPILKAITSLTSLRGIGPASASLLLSIMDPINVPFFSDEAYRWMISSHDSSNPWNIKIKYNKSEYESYLERVQDLQQRLEKVTACEIERVGFVLGKENANLTGSKINPKDRNEVSNIVNGSETEIETKPSSGSNKRKNDTNDEIPSKRSSRKGKA